MRSFADMAGGVARAARAFAWTARIELSGAVRYRFSFISDVVVYTVLLAFFVLSDSGHSFADKYG